MFSLEYAAYKRMMGNTNLSERSLREDSVAMTIPTNDTRSMNKSVIRRNAPKYDGFPDIPNR